MRVKSLSGEVDWKTQGGIRKWNCFLSAGVSMCERPSLLPPKNKMILLPLRPYGTDNKLVLQPSSLCSPRWDERTVHLGRLLLLV